VFIRSTSPSTSEESNQCARAACTWTLGRGGKTAVRFRNKNTDHGSGTTATAVERTEVLNWKWNAREKRTEEMASDGDCQRNENGEKRR